MNKTIEKLAVKHKDGSYLLFWHRIYWVKGIENATLFNNLLQLENTFKFVSNVPFYEYPDVQTINVQLHYETSETKHVQTFLRMYELKPCMSQLQAIAGIPEYSSTMTRKFIFGTQTGRGFEIKVSQEDYEEIPVPQKFNLQSIMRILKSQLKHDDNIDFIIDEDLVKTVAI